MLGFVLMASLLTTLVTTIPFSNMKIFSNTITTTMAQEYEL